MGDAAQTGTVTYCRQHYSDGLALLQEYAAEIQ